MAAERSGVETVVESFLDRVRVAVADRPTISAGPRFIDDVDAVSASVPAGNALRLTIQSQIERAKITELAHGVLRSTKAASTHGDSAVHASVCDSTVGR